MEEDIGKGDIFIANYTDNRATGIFILYHTRKEPVFLF